MKSLLPSVFFALAATLLAGESLDEESTLAPGSDSGTSLVSTSSGKQSVGPGKETLEEWAARNPISDLEPLERWGSPWVFSTKIQIGAAQRYYQGLDSLSIGSLRDEFRLLPNDIDFRRVLTSFSWNPRESDEIQVTIPIVKSKGRLEARDGAVGRFNTIGIGDIAIDYHRSFLSTTDHRNYARVGLLIPSGEDEKGIKMSDGPIEILPYGLQMGRGHLEARIGAGHERPLSDASKMGCSVWGSTPLESNDRGYRYGSSAGARIFYERDMTEWLTVRTRLTGRWADRISGRDRELNPRDSPVHDPSNYGITSLEMGIDFTYVFSIDPYRTRYLIWGHDVAVCRDTTGIQLVEQYFTTLGFGWRF